MLKIASMSLSGGQGKTTVAVLLAKYLADKGSNVILIDSDPQANATTFLGHTVESDEPTLLEAIKGTVSIDDAIYETDIPNLCLIPADDALDQVQDWLSSSGAGAVMLRKRLQPLKGFDICIMDSPPQRSQICKTIIGASDYILMPCESSVKGFGSMVRTLCAVDELNDIEVSSAQILGVVPFRDRWVGNNRTNESQICITAMEEELDGEAPVFPTIRESERYKQAISGKTTLKEIGYPDLEYPFEKILDAIRSIQK